MEVRISTVENIQEEFGYDIREVKEHLARLTSLFEDYIKTQATHSRDPSPLPKQQVPRPCIHTTSHLPRETHHLDLRQSMPIAPPTFRTTSRLVDQPNGSKEKPSGQRASKDKTKWDLIPMIYTKLLPKLIDNGFIEPVYLAPLKCPFPRWYDIDARYDHHAGIPGHSTENCNALKYRSPRFDQAWTIEI